MARPSQQIVRSSAAIAVTGFTGAAPQNVDGNAVNMNDVEIGSLAARVYALATTNTLTITAKWQVLDDDGSTWIDVANEGNAANVVLVTGTGAPVTKTILLPAPAAVHARSRARVRLVSGVGVGGGAGVDEGSVKYDYIRPSW